MNTFDLLFLGVLIIAQPVYGYWSWQRFVRNVRAGVRVNRPRLYQVTMAIQWAALALLLVGWWLLERPFALLGIHGRTGPGFWIVLIIGLAALAVLALYGRRVRRLTREQREDSRNALGDLVHFLPQSRRDMTWFQPLSITAGVVEELLYRGFMIWALSQAMPTWAAVLGASVAFGLCHSYQGPGGMLRTGAIGLVFAGLFLVSGSIWLPMAFHALFDIIQGMQIRELLRDTGGR